jgi:hypothetical protein
MDPILLERLKRECIWPLSQDRECYVLIRHPEAVYQITYFTIPRTRWSAIKFGSVPGKYTDFKTKAEALEHFFRTLAALGYGRDTVKEESQPTSETGQIWNICANGLHDYCIQNPCSTGCEVGSKRAVDPDELARARSYLSRLTRTKTFGSNTPNSYGLKHRAEYTTGAYVSNGALILAAVKEGILVRPYRNGNGQIDLNAAIAVSRRDIRKLRKLFENEGLPMSLPVTE